MKIFHIISGLTDGGAEGILYRLCCYDRSVEHFVICLTHEGKYGPLLIRNGVDVLCLNMLPGRMNVSTLVTIFKYLYYHKPDVVQTWMYHADLLGGFLARLAGVKRVFWNIRQSGFDREKSNKTTMLVAKVCAWLSRVIPTAIISCSHDGARFHSSLGYKASSITVISNGYDLDFFKVDRTLSLDFRTELLIKPETLLLGMVARFHPQKDHFGFLKALSIVKSNIRNFKVVLVGTGLTSDNCELKTEIKYLGLESNIFLLGQRTDISAVMNGIDINVLSSGFGEGFPNVLAEGMACGTPCVATDVGDAALIVGSTGWIVPPCSPNELANAILEAAEEKAIEPYAWSFRKVACRKHIEEHFGIKTLIRNYHKVWSK